MQDLTRILDDALACAPGVGTMFHFHMKDERDKFQYRLFGTMGAAKKRSERELDPTDDGWGVNPWAEVGTEKMGSWSLWVGRRVKPKEEAGVPLDVARKKYR
jgi:hypothetical protein